MAAEIKSEFGVEVELIESGGGIFDVAVDTDQIYSKKENGNQFPKPGEVIATLKSRI